MRDEWKSKPLAPGSLVVVINDQVEKALRKFKKKVTDSGLLQNLRDREHYVKPTTRRKQAKSAARRRWTKKLESEQLPKKLF
jgi:small subunit ribosomal protein S21